jgi:hypothetical protein
MASRFRSSSGLPPRAVSRSSNHTKQAATNGAAASMARVHAGQPCSRPSDSGSTRQASASETSSAPPMSSRRRWLALVSGISHQAASITGMPIGSFARNTVRQPKPNGLHATSAPPAN